MLYLFDIDGTLLHCHGAGRRAFERACQAVLGEGALIGIHLDGKTDPLILEEAFSARAGRAPSAAEADEIRARYCLLLKEETAAEGAVCKLGSVDEALRKVERDGGVLGLATGNWQDGARIKLLRVGLWSRFVLGGFGCDARERADLVRMARKRGEAHLGRPLSREEVLVIGDTPRDVAAAHAAGALAIAVATGRYTRAELVASGADAVYEDLGEWLGSV